jgi:hypothetical protein
MSRAKEFRAITEEVLAEREAIKRKAAIEFWVQSLDSLRECATEGRNYGYILIPTLIDEAVVLEAAEAEEFSVHKAIAYREYKICW